ncbi:hypothetical protein FQA39_LY06222 [Lamprigera yunnana]|nr:hypothetical protein FQA39_LY06222 [Lamprigera yunnana]
MDFSKMRSTQLTKKLFFVVDHLCQEKEKSGCKDIGLILKDVKAAFQSDSVVAHLEYIGAQFSHLPGLIKQLEDPSLSLAESTKLVNQALLNFPVVKAEKKHQKVVMVLAKRKKLTTSKMAFEAGGCGDNGIGCPLKKYPVLKDDSIEGHHYLPSGSKVADADSDITSHCSSDNYDIKIPLSSPQQQSITTPKTTSNIRVSATCRRANKNKPPTIETKII